MSAKPKLIDLIHELNGRWSGRCSCGSWATLSASSEAKVREMWTNHCRERHGAK
jgi:hypothetical protein